jgi:transcriptional regulator with XRE-family HTH domain
VDAEDTRTVGRRLREIRYWRGMSLRAVAELAGLSESHLSRIERGQRSVDKRSTLEALAHALQVAPGELTGQPFRPADPLTAEASRTIAELQVVLTEPALGDSWTRRGRPWPELAAERHLLNTVLRPAADYASQGRVLPGLLADLHAARVHEPDHRAEVLHALMDCYHAAEELTKSLGVPGLPQLAAVHAQTVAEELDTPAWLGLAAWLRGMTVGTSSRETMLTVSQWAAAGLQSAAGSPDAAQMYGAVHLNAALASAALNRPDDTDAHLAEADEIARVVPADAPRFGQVYFGLDNVGIWRVSLAVELGVSGGKLAEIARDVDPFAVPSKARQAMFFGDLGRGLARERSTRDQAVVALRRAEEIAPQLVRNNFYIRETATDLLRRARRDVVGRELRGMAYRMGLQRVG